MNDIQKQFNEIKKQVGELEASLNQVKNALNNINKEYLGTDYTQIDGEAGVFDGKHMTTKDGKKYDVPLNYAAKSKLVFGDTLKMVEDNGKQLFKQIIKVDRQKIDGILTKKEGEWYLLTDRGSYKVSDVAAEFQNAQLNSQATALIPAQNLDAPFATIDEVEGFNQNKPAPKTDSVEPKKEEKAPAKRPVKSTDEKPVRERTASKPAAKKPVASPKPETKDRKPTVKDKKEDIEEKTIPASTGTIDLDSDDLV